MKASALRLLIVEDSEQDARLMVRELERHGWQVRHLRVADRPALEQALTGEPWDAALLDHNLPGFSGQEALHLIRERDADIPLIMISGTIGEEQAVECLKAAPRLREGTSGWARPWSASCARPPCGAKNAAPT
jgi:CheY-like chemotaxis protein